MDKRQTSVKEFMEAAGQTVPKVPVIPSIKDRILRVKLLLEEVFELAEASEVDICIGNLQISSENFTYKDMDYGEVDLVAVADALADISYVNDGAGLCFGLDMEPIDDAVHAANMRKFAEGSFKREDGKHMKPPGWQGPEDEIQRIIDEQLYGPIN
jgi:predicted HAD superfamily Cof-like phosphohydrolase